MELTAGKEAGTHRNAAVGVNFVDVGGVEMG
jgi:hypothetical protein